MANFTKLIRRPFSNGNGRHARLMADLVIKKLQRPAFDWGIHETLHDASPIRK